MEVRIKFILVCLMSMVLCDILNPTKKKPVKFPPCKICKKLVGSFKKGIERTSRDNFAGGDTAWEEEKLGSYHRSEVRLVEIQEKLCLDVENAEAQCHSFAEDVETDLETWWFKKQDSDPDLEKWLCISIMKLCCESGHYGPECRECPGYPNAICNGNGKCKGAGTRTGNGQCECKVGYAGKQCEICAENYFKMEDEIDKEICSPCHVSCRSGCSDATSKGCKACKSGWLMEPSIGCVDIDECKNSKTACKSNEVCINNEGSYTCQDITHHGTKDPGKWVRYVTYMSFLIATGIFFRKSIQLGCFVGLIAAIYVSTSEIVMSDQMDLSKLDLRSWIGTS